MQGAIPTIIPQQILQLKQIFGINYTISNSISILSSDRLFYLAGYYGLVYNSKQKQKSQSYYTGAQGCIQISSIGISSNKKLLAMGFKSNDNPCIYYYELNASAKRKKIQYTDSFHYTSWVSIKFSTNNDTRHLASLSNKNNHGQSLLVFWNPQRGKCQAQIKIFTQSQKDLLELQFNPNSDFQVISILGQKSFLMYKLIENIEEKNFSLEEIENIPNPQLIQKYTLRSHIYLGTSQHIAILTQQCTLILDYKGNIYQQIKEIGQCCCNWSQGFVSASKNIYIYKYQEQNYELKLTYQYLNDKDTTVCSIDVNDDKILILLNNGCMMQGRIKFQTNKNTIKLQLDYINLHYHCQPIVGMDICVKKPLIVTASKDKTIKIWNYEDRTVQTPKSQSQAPSCLSFHPSGFHLAVAYSDKLRILNLQKDGESMSTFKDINSFRNCTYVKFSNGGQYFAAASGNLVHIFKFYTGQNPNGMTFSGHSGKIKCIAWSKEDNILVTCGTDGIILAYRVGIQNCGSKLLFMHSSKEPRIKGVSYSSVAITGDNTIYAMGMIGGGERIFKQIKLDGSDNKRQLSQNNSSQIIFSSTGRILFCGTDDKQHSGGSIKCYKFPSTQHMQQFQAHDNQGVEKLCVSSDDKYLITAGRDGCIMIFQIRDKQARSDRLKQLLPPSNEILITKTDLDTIKAQIDNLKQQKNQLEGINVMGPIKDDQVKQLKDKYTSDQSQFQQKYNAIFEKKNLLHKKFDEEIRTKRQEFENGLQQYDSNQAKNVMQESAKYDELKRSQQIQSRKFQKQIQKIEIQNKKDLKKIEQDFEQMIKNRKDQKINIKRKIQRLDKQHQQTMKQIRQQKIEELKKIDNQHGQQVQNITDSSLKAKSDVSLARKKISQKQQQKEQNQYHKAQNQNQIKELQKANQRIEKQIENQASIIQDRDKTIDTNERKIYQLKKKSQELQKFKYVLDHKIKELKKDIAPRQQQIARMKAQTNKMDKNLKDLNSLNTGLAQYVAVLFKDQESIKEKIANSRTKISCQNTKIKAFKDALYQTTQLIQNQQALKKNAIELKNKFVSQSMNQVKMDSQIEHQYRNQRKYLEKSITMLKKNLQKDGQIHKQENIRIMKENVDLIKQITSLRMQIKSESKDKGTDDQKKGKNQPKEDDIKLQIEAKKNKVVYMKKQIEDLQQRINQI